MLLLGVEVPQPAAAAPAGTVVLQTVPALAGVRLSVGSVVVTTGGDGSASARVADLAGITRRVTLAEAQLDTGTGLSIHKVVSLGSTRGQRQLGIGLDTTSLVRLSVASGDTGVPAESVRRVRLHSVTGQVLDVDPLATPVVRLQSRRARLSHGVLVAQRITWSVDRISAGAGVALTTSTTRFDPLRQSTWDLTLQPVNGTVQIRTVPATAGVTFAVEGATVTTGRDGTAVAPVDDLNGLDRRLRLDTADAGALSVSLLRVSKLKPRAIRHRRLLASLSVRRPVTLRFVDPSGHPVDASRVSEVRLQGNGSVIRLDAGETTEPVSLLSSIATQDDKVWRTRHLSYAVASVKIDGAEAVFAGRQRFTPSRAAIWPVTLSVFSLKVTVHDVVFGSRVSSKVWVTRPDGTRFAVHVTKGKPAVIPALVRGLYGLEVNSATFGANSNALVSRNDAVDIRVVTTLDAVLIALATVAFIAAAVVCGALLGRQRRRAVAGRA